MRSTDLAWDEIERLAGLLAAHLPAVAGGDGTAVVSFDRVIGVARGGLVPAVLLASRLEVKALESVQVQLYEGRRCLDEPVLSGRCPGPAGPSGDPARTLVVDEIVDSGRTLAFLHSLFPSASFCALLGRHTGSRGQAYGELTAVPSRADGPPVWVAADVETEAWILFPWSPPEDRDGEP